LSGVRNIAQLTLDPSRIPVGEHLSRFSQALGLFATVRALNASEPWRLLSDFSIYDTTEGQVIFCHLSPFEYQRPALEGTDGKARTPVAVTICLEGELICTYNRDHVARATPGQILVGLSRASTRIIAPVPSRYMILYVAQPSMLSATVLTPSNPVIESPIAAGAWPVLSAMIGQLRTTLHNDDDTLLGPIMKSLEVFVDQLARSQFLRLSHISEDRMMAIQAFVDENIRHPQLGVKLLCDRFHMSRATLYRQMHHLGGVKHYLLSRRLICCFDDISKASSRDEGYVKVLIKSYNFKSLQDFNRRYKKHFGSDPAYSSDDMGVIFKSANGSEQVFIAPPRGVDI